jgi:hypothetical protein
MVKQKLFKISGVWCPVSVMPIIHTQEAEAGETQVLGQSSKVSETLFQKQNINERAGGMSVVLQYLPTMYETMGSIPSTAKNIKNIKFTMWSYIHIFEHFLFYNFTV